MKRTPAAILFMVMICMFLTNCSNSTSSTPSGAPDYTTLASGLSNPYQIAVDSTSVYWTEYTTSGAVKKVGINGGTVTTLASGLNYPKGIAVDSTMLAVDSTSAYWADGFYGTINKVQK